MVRDLNVMFGQPKICVLFVHMPYNFVRLVFVCASNECGLCIFDGLRVCGVGFEGEHLSSRCRVVREKFLESR